jgi:hypothetical protein
MALTYAESATLMKDPAFVDRVKVASLKYADFIFIEATDVPAHNTRLRWAQQTMSNPDSNALQITPPVVMDGAVQSAGVDAAGHSLITDEALQTTVETVVNKLM